MTYSKSERVTFPRAGRNIPLGRAAGNSPPVLLALIAVREGKIRSRAGKKTVQRRLPAGNQLALKRTVPVAFVCIARDLFSIYFPLFVV